MSSSPFPNTPIPTSEKAAKSLFCDFYATVSLGLVRGGGGGEAAVAAKIHSK